MLGLCMSEIINYETRDCKYIEKVIPMIHESLQESLREMYGRKGLQMKVIAEDLPLLERGEVYVVKLPDDEKYKTVLTSCLLRSGELVEGYSTEYCISVEALTRYDRAIYLGIGVIHD